MQFVDIEKKDGGAFLHRYDLHYIDRTGCPRTYEMVSRDRNIDSLEHLQHHRTDAVVMVLTDAAREHIALIHEFRMELGQRIYGLPGGLIEPGETPEQAARRELREETGATAKHFESLGTLYPSPGYCGEIIHIIGAIGLEFGENHLDDGEFLESFRLPLKKAVSLVMSGDIVDAKTQIAILKLALYKGIFMA